jgi:hypothetical protein
MRSMLKAVIALAMISGLSANAFADTRYTFCTATAGSGLGGTKFYFSQVFPSQYGDDNRYQYNETLRSNGVGDADLASCGSYNSPSDAQYYLNYAIRSAQQNGQVIYVPY